jgi:hypothetical protein
MLRVKVASAQETVLKADAEELWIAFGSRDSHKRAEIEFWAHAERADIFSDGGNVTLESTQEDRIDNGCI